MSSVDVKDHEGTKTASVELPADIFDVQANIPLMHQVVVAQLAAARQGTHKVKTRGEVAGGGRKPYKQKGTGRARQGSIRAPQFTGGGVVHGPVPRDYTQRVNKKMKVAALRGALSDRARAGVVHVVEGFLDGETPRTKDALAALANFTDSRKVLVVLPAEDEINWYSLRNLPQVHLIEASQLNTYDVLNAEAVIFTSPALDEFLGVPAERTEVPVSEKKAEKADKPEKAEKGAKAEKADKAEKAPKAKKDDDADEEEEK
ncbi:50S ribosomal protein L4 [Virgisporangium aurantiacum]|uniref:Large ribosomal subunit protein uL4 n=1 Tax=Virgisporangium aurantiacum TaxID=175570 RepID=A0A8J4E266_9ACTN|nr:50S ribosomal protein L4 [Virgisporangium aurantiacum]